MLVIGHRGAEPENTIEGLTKALNYKVDAIEFDVRVTADGVPVLSHDPNLVPVKGHGRIVARSTLRELKETFPALTTLEEALRLINNRVGVIIEIKPEVNPEPVKEVIEDRLKNGWDIANIGVASFDFRILKWCKRHMPRGTTIIVNEPWSGLRAFYRSKRLKTKFVTMNHAWLWLPVVISAKRGGYKLSVYTLNRKRKAKRFKRYGLHAIITDRPDRFISR